jgi:CO/xanthine dehydrogenase Mo-binding subunit
LTELAKSCAEFGNPLKVQGSVHLPKPGRLTEDNCPPISAVDITFCAARAEVEIDPSTGSIDVLSLTLAQDTGRAVNPLNVQVQMEGGAVMGFGYAIIEEMRWLKRRSRGWVIGCLPYTSRESGAANC